MVELLAIVSGLSGLGSLVCLIMVVIPLFKTEGALWGIFGIICGIYTFVWGWQNAEKHQLGKVMRVWTAFFVAGLLANILAAVAGGGA